jgi:putative SbcD/Mre11-related phosphoesterase
MRVLGDWLLTPARAAIHLPTATAVIADVHLGYGEARHRGGDAVPRRSVDEVFAALRPVLSAHSAGRLVIAGDLFEAGALPALVADLHGWCDRVGVSLAVVPGNHDRGLDVELPIRPEMVLGTWHVVHGDGALPDAPIIQGHEHPCIRWSGHVAAPCYLVGTRRLILPAFSPDAAGVNVLGAVRWRDFRHVVVAENRLLDFGFSPSGKPGLQRRQARN